MELFVIIQFMTIREFVCVLFAQNILKIPLAISICSLLSNHTERRTNLSRKSFYQENSVESFQEIDAKKI